MYSLFLHNFISSLCITALLFVSLPSVFAQVMSSGNYAITSDSINIGGGLSSSTNYALESTVGEVATGPATSTTYALRAGYQQMQETFIAISGVNNVAMTPAINGITGGEATGSTTATVTTDSPSGYSLTIRASTSPAMQNGADTIADYVPAGSDPDYTFTTVATSSHFGFSPDGADVVERYLSVAVSSCNDSGGSSGAAICWDGLSTTDATIAQGAGANHPSGATTTVYFRTGIGSSVIQPGGTYIATTTLTALPL